MLGQTPEREAASFANRLFAGPWTDPANRAHEGYARDRFRWLMGRETPPPELPSIGRRLELLAWHLMRAFRLLQQQRARLEINAEPPPLGESP